MGKKPSSPVTACVAIGILTSVLNVPAFAEIPKESIEARALAVGCAGCHGEKGEGRGSLPPLNQLDREVFVQRFLAYKSDHDAKKTATVMHRIANGFSEDEIRQLAKLLAKESRR